ncbi:MAG: hypothetical protein NC328_02060 [Muribaculum sp.]|nr:hypothetical protein [Muribaculum sp.]
MKALKLIFFGLALVAVIGLVIWISDPAGSIIAPKASPQAERVVSAIDNRWDTLPGWNDEAYALSIEEIKRQRNEKMISGSDEDVCLRHLNEVALNKTVAALDSLYSLPGCTVAQVDRQYSGLQKIGADAKFADDANIKRHSEIHGLYKRALAFSARNFSFPTGYRAPDSWNKFSGASFSNEAAAIRNSPKWDVIKNITAVKTGLAQSTVDGKIAKAKKNYAASLSSQIIAAFSAMDHSEENRQRLADTWQKFHNEGLPDANLKEFYTKYSAE